MTEILELSDDQLKDIHGGCAGTTLGLGGLHLGFGGFHGFRFGFGGFSGFSFAPVQQVTLVPVQTATVVQPVGVTGVQATSCQQSVALALV